MLTQQEFARAGGGHTQCALILERLRQEPGTWVAMPELARVSGSLNVAVRVQDIRLRTGLAIENLVKRNKQTGLNDSWYRLTTRPEQVPA